MTRFSMTQAPNPATSRPTERATSAPTADESQDAKRFEKMQAHCSSHRTAGTHETPISAPNAGILWELETQGGQH